MCKKHGAWRFSQDTSMEDHMCKKHGAWRFSQDPSMEDHMCKKHGVAKPTKGSSRPKRNVCEMDGDLFHLDEGEVFARHLRDRHPWHSLLSNLDDGRVIKREKPAAAASRRKSQPQPGLRRPSPFLLRILRIG